MVLLTTNKKVSRITYYRQYLNTYFMYVRNRETSEDETARVKRSGRNEGPKRTDPDRLSCSVINKHEIFVIRIIFFAWVQ